MSEVINDIVKRLFGLKVNQDTESPEFRKQAFEKSPWADAFFQTPEDLMKDALMVEDPLYKEIIKKIEEAKSGQLHPES